MTSDATVRYSPSGLKSDFSGRPCPEIAVQFTEYQENLIFLRNDNFGNPLYRLSSKSLIKYFMSKTY